MKSDYDRSKTIFCKTTENYHPLDPLPLNCRHINSGIQKDEYVCINYTLKICLTLIYR